MIDPDAGAQDLIDISPAVAPGAPVFPGDAPFRFGWTMRLDERCPVNVAEVMLSPHTGAHADAPLHYDPRGASIGEVPLATYLGRCRVLDARAARSLVRPADLGAAFATALPARVLVRTAEHAVMDRWTPDFTALAPETIDALHAAGVRLVGIDTPSIDPADSKRLASHQRVRAHGMAILENLVLDGVAPGDYELIALPLRWIGVDASPVRAVLRRLPTA